MIQVKHYYGIFKDNKYIQLFHPFEVDLVYQYVDFTMMMMTITTHNNHSHGQRILFHTRDPKGIVSIHQLDEQSSTSQHHNTGSGSLLYDNMKRIVIHFVRRHRVMVIPI